MNEFKELRIHAGISECIELFGHILKKNPGAKMIELPNLLKEEIITGSRGKFKITEKETEKGKVIVVDKTEEY